MYLTFELQNLEDLEAWLFQGKVLYAAHDIQLRCSMIDMCTT